MSKVLIFFTNLLLIYLSNFPLYINNEHLRNIINYKIYNYNMVSSLVIKRTLTEMLIYNSKSQLKVSQINKNTHDNEKNKISSRQTELLRTSKNEPKNNDSENTNNYNITKKEETLEDLLKEYDKEMKEINNNNKKKFFKRSKLVLEAFDNIFIDKVIDSDIHNKKSELKEDVVDNAVTLCGSLILAIPVLSYFFKRINFFHSPQ
ncbi:Plasmodium exported protein (hyp6), unknown function [Plasmodium reichenowi]|uniref:Exported protein (Hyp6) n=1 Tax=Plasmodium reichenowi TaxID=5854 RepID=A0A2P9D6H1_PLARE|nr:Plasmodium exported protein (hyp6), unknown function [Plasmodium reichenowi]